MFHVRRDVATSMVAPARLGTGIDIAVAEETSSVSRQDSCIRMDIPDWQNNARAGRRGCAKTPPNTVRVKEDCSYVIDGIIREIRSQAGIRWDFG